MRRFKTQLLNLLAISFLLSSHLAQAQCPRMVSVMVDACNGTSTEGDNEFMILRNGGNNLPPGNLNVYYSTMTPPTSASGSSLTTFGGSTGFTGSYSAAEISKINTLNSVTSCGNVFATTIPATGIPANAYMLVMTAASTVNYDFSGLCQQAPVYLLFQQVNSGSVGFNLSGSGRFKNNSGTGTTTPRYFSVTSSTYSSCTEASSIRSYIPDQLTKFGGTYDGATITWNAVGTTTLYSNNGCLSITILPITLTSFTGQRTGSQVRLNWSMENKNDMAQFQVQSSADGIGFKTRETLPASGFQTSFSSSLNDVANDKFFRLKAVYKSGKEDFSNTLQLPLTSANEYKLVVLTDALKRSFTAQINAPQQTQGIIQLYNINGRQLVKQQTYIPRGTSQISLPVADLPAGNYFVKMTTDESVLTAHLLKE